MNIPSRNFLFTSFVDELNFGDLVKGVAYQQEVCPSTGRTHWQGYVEFSKPVKRPQAQREIGDEKAHLEVRKGTREQAIAYCTKEDTRAPGAQPEVIGSCQSGKGGQGERNDIKAVAEEIKKNGLTAAIEAFPHLYIKFSNGMKRLAEAYQPKGQEWRDLEIICLLGKSGAGKSRKVFEFVQGKQYFKPAFPEGGRTWWDGYSGEEILWLDDLDGSWFRYRHLLQILDGYPLKIQTKGGMTNANWKIVLITTNKHPEKWYDIPDEEKEPLLRRIQKIDHCE